MADNGSFSVPELVGGYNVYNGKEELIGVAGEVTLPELNALTDSMSGSGMLGEVETPALGHFGSTELEIPFRQINPTMFKLLSQGPSVNVTLRGGVQQRDSETGEVSWWPIRIVVRGANKSLSLGKFQQAKGTGSSIKLEISYILIEINEVRELELDKINSKYVVNGKDVLKPLREMCSS